MQKAPLNGTIMPCERVNILKYKEKRPTKKSFEDLQPSDLVQREFFISFGSGQPFQNI